MGKKKGQDNDEGLKWGENIEKKLWDIAGPKLQHHAKLTSKDSEVYQVITDALNKAVLEMQQAAEEELEAEVTDEVRKTCQAILTECQQWPQAGASKVQVQAKIKNRMTRLKDLLQRNAPGTTGRAATAEDYEVALSGIVEKWPAFSSYAKHLARHPQYGLHSVSANTWPVPVEDASGGLAAALAGAGGEDDSGDGEEAAAAAAGVQQQDAATGVATGSVARPAAAAAIAAAGGRCTSQRKAAQAAAGTWRHVYSALEQQDDVFEPELDVEQEDDADWNVDSGDDEVEQTDSSPASKGPPAKQRKTQQGGAPAAAAAGKGAVGKGAAVGISSGGAAGSSGGGTGSSAATGAAGVQGNKKAAPKPAAKPKGAAAGQVSADTEEPTNKATFKGLQLAAALTDGQKEAMVASTEVLVKGFKEGLAEVGQGLAEGMKAMASALSAQQQQQQPAQRQGPPDWWWRLYCESISAGRPPPPPPFPVGGAGFYGQPYTPAFTPAHTSASAGAGHSGMPSQPFADAAQNGGGPEPNAAADGSG